MRLPLASHPPRTPQSLGKGLGDGVLSVPIESLHPGDHVLTHCNRFMPVLEVLSRAYSGEMLEIKISGCDQPLYHTPNHPVAAAAPDLPPFQVRTSTVRQLRKNPTPSETRMWSLLRQGQTGARFRRQHPLGPFVRDFYAPEARLAIELDGSVHERADQRDYDQFRQETVERHGIEFMRFSNEEIDHAPEAVSVRVAEKAKSRLRHHSYKITWLAAGRLEEGMRVFADGQRLLPVGLGRFLLKFLLYRPQFRVGVLDHLQ